MEGRNGESAAEREREREREKARVREREKEDEATYRLQPTAYNLPLRNFPGPVFSDSCPSTAFDLPQFSDAECLVCVVLQDRRCRCDRTTASAGYRFQRRTD